MPNQSPEPMRGIAVSPLSRLDVGWSRMAQLRMFGCAAKALSLCAMERMRFLKAHTSHMQAGTWFTWFISAAYSSASICTRLICLSSSPSAPRCAAGCITSIQLFALLIFCLSVFGYHSRASRTNSLKPMPVVPPACNRMSFCPAWLSSAR